MQPCLYFLPFPFLQPSFLPVKPDPPPVCPVSIPVSQSTHFRVINHELTSEQCGPCSEISALRLMMPEETAEETGLGKVSECVRMESQSETAESQKAEAAAAAMMCDGDEALCRPPGKMDSPSKRKGDDWRENKRTAHL